MASSGEKASDATGDAMTMPYKEIVISMGEGAKAALAAFVFLIQHPIFSKRKNRQPRPCCRVILQVPCAYRLPNLSRNPDAAHLREFESEKPVF